MLDAISGPTNEFILSSILSCQKTVQSSTKSGQWLYETSQTPSSHFERCNFKIKKISSTFQVTEKVLHNCSRSYVSNVKRCDVIWTMSVNLPRFHLEMKVARWRTTSNESWSLTCDCFVRRTLLSALFLHVSALVPLSGQLESKVYIHSTKSIVLPQVQCFSTYTPRWILLFFCVVTFVKHFDGEERGVVSVINISSASHR